MAKMKSSWVEGRGVGNQEKTMSKKAPQWGSNENQVET